MNLTRALFKLASILTTGKIISSGNAGRIGKHIVRRQLSELERAFVGIPCFTA